MKHNDSASNRNKFLFINNISYTKRAIKSQINIFVKLFLRSIKIYKRDFPPKLLLGATKLCYEGDTKEHHDTLLNR